MAQPISLTPSIRLNGSSGTQHEAISIPPRPSPHISLSTSPAMPMPIRTNLRDDVPPPLPPPRHLEELKRGQDPGWQWANGKISQSSSLSQSRNYNVDSETTSIKPGSSLLGQSRFGSRIGNMSDIRDAAPSRAPLSLSLPAQQDRNDDRASRPSLPRLHSEKQLSWNLAHNTAEQFDRQILSKLDSGATSARRPPGTASLPKEFILAHRDNRKSSGPLPPEPMSATRYYGPESPRSRWPAISPTALSPASTSFRSPLSETQTIDRAIISPTIASDHYDDLRYRHAPHRNSVEQSVFSDPEFAMDDSGLRDLNISDKSPSSIGDDHFHGRRDLKRRANSPTYEEAARDDRAQANGPYNDLYHRRSMQMLQHRFTAGGRPMPGESFSSTTSYPMSNPHSIGSQWTVASSATSRWSEKLSPGPISPLIDAESTQYSHYHGHGRADHDQHRSPKLMAPGGGYTCECCLKKPKRFRTINELRAHEGEKVYKCQYCPNRFKNKNEAERHQNSLHLRKFSWSCSALSTVHAAFHTSNTHRGAVDECGYCGAEFQNNNEEGGAGPDWLVRQEHLIVAHKYGECNQQKKFFRADHFRQHLKHSHGAQSGKWTNILETACVRDEPLPKPLGRPGPRPGLLTSRETSSGDDHE